MCRQEFFHLQSIVDLNHMAIDLVKCRPSSLSLSFGGCWWCWWWGNPRLCVAAHTARPQSSIARSVITHAHTHTLVQIMRSNFHRLVIFYFHLIWIWFSQISGIRGGKVASGRPKIQFVSHLWFSSRCCFIFCTVNMYRVTGCRLRKEHISFTRKKLRI